MTLTLYRLGAFAVPLLLLAACADDTVLPQAPSSDNLDGRTFVGDDVKGHGLVKGSRLRLSFKDGKLDAHAGCNHLSGTGRLDDGLLLGGIDVTTDMGCDRPLMAQDTWFSGFLSSSPRAAVSPAALVLTKDGVTLTLEDEEHARAAQPIPLEGTTWTLESILTGTGADGVASSVVGDAPTLVVESGRIELFTGCNSGSGDVQVGSRAMTVSGLALTQKACADSATSEQAVLAVLSGEVSYEQEYDVLTLTAGDGQSGLQYRAVR